jgi:hypothetical protein
MSASTCVPLDAVDLERRERESERKRERVCVCERERRVCNISKFANLNKCHD